MNSVVIIDGTRKIHTWTGFKRDWPNVVVSDEKTINKIDEIWTDLNLGPFIQSPSLKYKKLNHNLGAVAKNV